MSQSLSADFDHLNRSCFVQKHNTKPILGQNSAPDYVILFTWVDARPQHIFKYVHGYWRHFPGVRVIIITTNLRDMVFQLSTAERSCFEAAFHVLANQPNAKILTHSFSNGGAYRATQFHLAYSKRFRRHFSAKAMILDSTPGKGTFRRTMKAITFSLPKQRAVRLLSSFVVYVALALLWTVLAIFQKDNLVTRARDRLNDPQIISIQAPRCYLYSKADDLVWWEDVEEHISQAEQRGWWVNRVRFSHSNHVNHPKEDATRYWDAVRGTWDVGTTGLQHSS